MGHDIHFLQRLERVSLPQVELAMSLYNDSPLVHFILGTTRLPDSAEKVAISLAHPEEGPFLIVARTGHFVTCLGAGMRLGPEIPVITRQHLDSILSKVEDHRERVQQAYRVAGNKGRVHQLLRRIYTAADGLSREEFIGISAWRPLMGREFLAQLLGAASYLVKARKVLRKLDKPPKQYEGALREYWNTFWAVGHLTLLAGENIRETLEALPEVLSDLAASNGTISWGIVRQGFVPLGMRGAWLAGKLGRSGISHYKNLYERAVSPLQLIDSGLGLLALAARHGSLRGEIRKALPREFADDDTAFQDYMRGLVAAARMAFHLCMDQPEQYQAHIQDVGRRFHLRLTGLTIEPSQVRPEQLASVRDELIMPALALPPQCFMSDMNVIMHLFMVAPYAARMQAEDFYYAQADLGTVTRPWVPEDSLQLLRSYRDQYEGGARRPVRVEKTPGRNEPCPCGSGAKYKRCCIGREPPQPGL